jgi:hypothetical protein
VIPLRIEICHALLPLGVVLPKLVEDHLGVWIRGSLAVLEASVVVMRWEMLQIIPMWMELPRSSSRNGWTRRTKPNPGTSPIDGTKKLGKIWIKHRMNLIPVVSWAWKIVGEFSRTKEHRVYGEEERGRTEERLRK